MSLNDRIMRGSGFPNISDSYFPDHFLCEKNLCIENADYQKKIQAFELLINDSRTQERNILTFIKEQKAAFIIGAILKRTSFGHHDRYVFREFSLGTKYKADFLVVGKNSSGYHFIFVELENPHNKITLRDGEFGHTIRTGLHQIQDWQSWNESSFSHLEQEFEKLKNKSKVLPNEFRKYDSTRINYFVIAGRRDDFNDKTYQLARKKEQTNNITVWHYDNLIDTCNSLIKDKSY